MHIANITSASLDRQIEPVDLQQTPGDIVVLSFSDSDLTAIARSYELSAEKLPTMRLAALKDLRHPMSVDLWIDSVARHARVILIRILGGYDYWSYGCERLAEMARTEGIALVLLPGECSVKDERLAALSTVPPDDLSQLLATFREGGTDNMTALLYRLANLSGHALDAPAIKPISQMGFYAPGKGTVSIDEFVTLDVTAENGASPRPIVPILFYRAMLLAGETAPIDCLVEALAQLGLRAVPIFVPTLKDRAVAQFLRETAETLRPAILITTTAFAASIDGASGSLFDDLGVPVVQAIIATTRRDAWADGDRGLGTSDIAMHVVLPELDGRILAGALSFKDFATPPDDLTEPPPGPLQFSALQNRSENSRVALVAARVAALIRLQATPASEQRLLIIMPDYPGAKGRTGYAVGLDVPASVLAILDDLAAAGYTVGEVPATPRELLSMLAEPKPAMTIATWAKTFETLPQAARQQVVETWGQPPSSHETSGESAAFRFRHATFGNVTVALAPDRGKAADRRADYHDPALPPRHELLAFGAWAREELRCDAIIHCGAHGTLEWLPGKAVALSENCFPELVTGALPVIYPFIVNNPGEAAQAKRRIAALTIGHLPPPMIEAGLSSEQLDLERLVDEYVQADGMDFRRQKRLAELILVKAAETGLDRIAGVAPGDDDGSALKSIDTWLCDLKDLAIRDGQHIFGRSDYGDDHSADDRRSHSARNEAASLLAALNGRFVPPGPAGSPSRGRQDIYPTGRNLFTIDPRMMPTTTAFELGTKAAEEVLRYYLQEHGDWPGAIVIDLWASASLRTGGEEIAQGLALLGCRPVWDGATGRVTGIEVLPPAAMGRPRIDVTWRISGLFRDMFPAQIALMTAAIEAIARRAEEDCENPLAAAYRSSGILPKRVFGSAPGTYGSGAEELLQSGDWQNRVEIGEAYLAAGSYSYSGAEGTPELATGELAERLSQSDLLVHTSDDTGHDVLEGSADVAYMGGFAAAAAALGSNADVISLDTTNPANLRARSLVDAITRVVHGRAVNPRYITGQMRHGPRGASDFAETVDRLVAFAETTEALPDELIDAVHDAYVGNDAVREFILHENPAAACAIAERLTSAMTRGLWHPRRNSTADELAAMLASARAVERAS